MGNEADPLAFPAPSNLQKRREDEVRTFKVNRESVEPGIENTTKKKGIEHVGGQPDQVSKQEKICS